MTTMEAGTVESDYHGHPGALKIINGDETDTELMGSSAERSATAEPGPNQLESMSSQQFWARINAEAMARQVAYRPRVYRPEEYMD